MTGRRSVDWTLTAMCLVCASALAALACEVTGTVSIAVGMGWAFGSLCGVPGVLLLDLL